MSEETYKCHFCKEEYPSSPKDWEWNGCDYCEDVWVCSRRTCWLALLAHEKEGKSEALPNHKELPKVRRAPGRKAQYRGKM